MKIWRLCLGFALLLATLPAAAADAGVITIADGSARVLRGTVWYRLVAGVPIQEGDLIDAGDRTLVQAELATGAIVHIVGPGAFYAASMPIRNDKQEGPMEFGLDRGWAKVVSPPGPGLRLRTASALVNAGEAIFVARQEGKLFEVFVESGFARVAESNRVGRDGAVHDAKAGEYWSRDTDGPFLTERRAPPQFVAVMPRHLMDRLVPLAAKFKGRKATLAVEREITLAEADPWLAGPYRRVFARRLSGRLADPTFRNAVEANPAAYPDFDRILHPEKYPAPQAVMPVPPAQAAPQKSGPRSALPTIVAADSALARRPRP